MNPRQSLPNAPLPHLLGVWAAMKALGAAGALALWCQAAAVAHEVVSQVTVETSTEPSPAAQLVARQLRDASGSPQAAASGRAPRRMGMHVVVRVAVVDMVSHPDSGGFDVVLRSRLLNRSIARAPLAVGVTWRF